jgi:hypothetical protein
VCHLPWRGITKMLYSRSRGEGSGIVGGWPKIVF